MCLAQAASASTPAGSGAAQAGTDAQQADIATQQPVQQQAQQGEHQQQQQAPQQAVRQGRRQQQDLHKEWEHLEAIACQQLHLPTAAALLQDRRWAELTRQLVKNRSSFEHLTKCRLDLVGNAVAPPVAAAYGALV